MIETACAFTGHRPSRFSFGYEEESPACIQLKRALALQIENLAATGIKHFYTGMALGVDTWAAEIVLNLRETRTDIELTAVLPCETQSIRWAEPQRDKYFSIIQQCDYATMLSRHYTPTCMMERNRYLVEHAGHLLAVYDGGPKGGTAYTVKYAEEMERQITVIHPDTLGVTLPAFYRAEQRRREFIVLPEKEK